MFTKKKEENMVFPHLELSNNPKREKHLGSDTFGSRH